MKILIILLLSIIHLTISDSSKMIIIYGEPQNSPTFTVQNMDFATCVDYCYETEECMGVYNENVGAGDCHVFDNGKLREVQELDGGSKVAFKINATDSTCPLPSAQSFFGGQGLNTYRVTLTNGVWQFVAYPTCPDNFQMFLRPKGKWCIGVVVTDDLINQPNAIAECSSRFQGVLTGLENMDEFSYIQSTGVPMVTAIMPRIKDYNEVGFWINGARKGTCQNTVLKPECNGTNEFTFTDPTLSADPTGYLWGPDQPSGRRATDSNCILYRFNIKTGVQDLDDYKCTQTVSDTKNASFVGYVCGVAPS